MSCGKPHDVPCTEVLARVYSYLDGEIEVNGYSQIREHLEECGPCLREYGLEEAVKRDEDRCPAGSSRFHDLGNSPAITRAMLPDHETPPRDLPEMY